MLRLDVMPDGKLIVGHIDGMWKSYDRHFSQLLDMGGTMAN